MRLANNNRTLIGKPLDSLKYQVAAELAGKSFDFETADELTAFAKGESLQGAWGNAGANYEDLKMEIAQEVGVPFRRGYNGDMTARQAGTLGGHIGGNMVKRMIRMAEEQLARGAKP